MDVAEVVALIVGFAVVIVVLSGAVRTVVVPRAEQVLLTRLLFSVMREIFELLAGTRRSWMGRDRVLARYAPYTLMLLPVLWAAGVACGFTLIFWSIGAGGWEESWLLSGSSLTTLGFRSVDGVLATSLAIVEGLLGLGLVALLISFLPTMYSQFSRREALISRLHVLAEPARSPERPHGAAPDPETMITRIAAIGRFEALEEIWIEWEQFFRELEEAHTTFAALNFFRSVQPNRSWVVSAGVILDSAALFQSTVDVPSSSQAQLMLRSGYTALRRIADTFGLVHDPFPEATDPITFERDRFDALVERFAAAGVPLKPDREQAWRDFAGWRVNYDSVLHSLLGLTAAPPSDWFGAEIPHERQRVFRK